MAAILRVSAAGAGDDAPIMANSAPIRTLRRIMWNDICGLLTHSR
jgi:hypothetical protein